MEETNVAICLSSDADDSSGDEAAGPYCRETRFDVVMWAKGKYYFRHIFRQFPENIPDQISFWLDVLFIGTEYKDSDTLAKHRPWQAKLIERIADSSVRNAVSKFVDAVTSKLSSCQSKRSLRQVLCSLRQNSPDDIAALWKDVLDAVKSTSAGIQDNLMGMALSDNITFDLHANFCARMH